MSATNGDPRVAELLRRRAERNGTPESSPLPVAVAAPESRKLGDDDRAWLLRAAAEHPKWSASDLADAFESEHGWRPCYQGIGRALAEPAPRKATGRKPAPRKAAAPDPAAEVEAIAAVSRALAPLGPDEVRRVLDWAGARFGEGRGS